MWVAHLGMAAARGPLDTILVASGAVVVIVTTILSVLYLIRPGETRADHIKRLVLEEGREGLP
jgi:hypothetical protein